ncbi:hypothetical protein DKX38_000879 [Salix brachista]|uniref:EXS domain-containing protein n=1 Tax=Salix brachista TaxID=2182728 RepID=A0A5N5P1W3_9ROSI|nr:hypothetical protein DKX38_000879 [Salix brachista]
MSFLIMFLRICRSMSFLVFRAFRCIAMDNYREKKRGTVILLFYFAWFAALFSKMVWSLGEFVLDFYDASRDWKSL